MINSSKGEVRIEGNLAEILSDFSMATRSMLKALEKAEGRAFAEKRVREAFEDGFRSTEDIANELKKIAREKLNSGETKRLLTALLEAITEED